MSYIYKVTNKINGRSYIGSTNRTPHDRWIEHISSSKSERCKDRPLYIAMNKYRVENFDLETIEECDDDIAFEREIYWIDFYDTFRNGYNATYGGGGKSTIDYGLVYETYKQLGLSLADTADRLGISKDQASIIIRSLSGANRLKRIDKRSVRVNMFSKDMKYIRTFSSINDASKFLVEQNGVGENCISGYGAHISKACRGERKSAGGYIWKYAS